MTSIDFDKEGADTWINSLQPYQASMIHKMRNNGIEFEEIAINLLSRTGSDNTAPFGADGAPKNYFDSLKEEFRKFLCGDESYEDLRKQVSENWNKGKLPIATTITAVIANVLGLLPAVVLPVVMILLAMAAEIGRKAWCELQ